MSLVSKELLGGVFKDFVRIFVLSFFVFSFLAFYFLAFVSGYIQGEVDSQNFYLSFYEKMDSKIYLTPTQSQAPTITVSSPTVTAVPVKQSVKSQSVSIDESGLWTRVNDKRLGYGVNPLKLDSDLCEIARARLSDLLKIGNFDGHSGFWKLKEAGSDLSRIFDKYTSVSEFLAMDGQTPEKTVALWDNSPEHKKLLNDGEYIWGCIYSQGTFSVAITAY